MPAGTDDEDRGEGAGATKARTLTRGAATPSGSSPCSIELHPIIGASSGGSYADNVTANRYNGHITDINLHARPSDICECTLAMLCIKLCKLNQAAQCLFATGTGTKKQKVPGRSHHTKILS